jgi:hypothetical protein
VVLWSVWGLLVAGLVLLLDPDPWLAGPWAVGGIIIGLAGMRIVRAFSSPLLEWYSSRNPDATLTHRIFSLIGEGKADTDEYKRCMAEQTYWMCLPVAPLFGLLHGTLAGAVVGAFCGFDSESGVPASSGAALGLLVGPVFVSFVAALTLATLVRPDPGLPLQLRLARRGLLLVSPLLIVPAVWHCLKRGVSAERWRNQP